MRNIFVIMASLMLASFLQAQSQSRLVAPPIPPLVDNADENAKREHSLETQAWNWGLDNLEGTRDSLLAGAEDESLSADVFDSKIRWTCKIEYIPGFGAESFLLMRRMTNGKVVLRYVALNGEKLHHQLMTQKIKMNPEKPLLSRIEKVSGEVDSDSKPVLLDYAKRLEKIKINVIASDLLNLDSDMMAITVFGRQKSEMRTCSSTDTRLSPLVAWSVDLAKEMHVMTNGKAFKGISKK